MPNVQKKRWNKNELSFMIYLYIMKVNNVFEYSVLLMLYVFEQISLTICLARGSLFEEKIFIKVDDDTCNLHDAIYGCFGNRSRYIRAGCK